MAGCVALLLAVAVASVMVGSLPIPPDAVFRALVGDARTVDAQTVLELRVPRTLVAIVVGSALAVAGALIQALTRNPLADPGILGVNAGASFAVVIGLGFLGVVSIPGMAAAALTGAAAAAVLVYVIGSTGRARRSGPVTLVLVGVAIGAVLQGISGAILLLKPGAFTAARRWDMGSLTDRSLDMFAQLSPLIVAGLVVAMLVAPSLNAISLGDDVARSLGVRLGLIRTAAIIGITLLCGAGTALAGPIGFVGLMVPHVVRWLFGVDQRWIMAFSIVLGPTLLLVSDILGRLVIWPGELPAGIVTAFVGGPILILLARRREATGL
jgi:iron complex transport system permease protein